jgi:hypothetical protein
MDELIDLIISDESPSQISDQIKDILFAKSSERIEEIKPNIADSLFNSKE